jgi:drug/metabolite transporter (DMT)-like permease
MKESSSANKSFAPHLALLGVQMMFGAGPVVGKVVLQTFPSIGVVAFRVGGAAIAFIILQLILGEVWLERRGDYLRLALYSLLGVILNQLLFIGGLSLTTATNTSLLAVTIPVFAALISTIFGFDRLNLRKIIGITLAACGVISLIDPTRASFSSATTRGDLMIIFNSLAYASYIAISKDTIARNGALRSLAWLFLFGSLICVPLGAFTMSNLDFATVSAQTWALLAFMVLVPTIGAYYLNAWALARVAPSVVAVYIYLQPLIGFTLAVLFLGEHFTRQSGLAGLLIFLGVFLVTKPKMTKQEADMLEHQTAP